MADRVEQVAEVLQQHLHQAAKAWRELDWRVKRLEEALEISRQHFQKQETMLTAATQLLETIQLEIKRMAGTVGDDEPWRS